MWCRSALWSHIAHLWIEIFTLTMFFAPFVLNIILGCTWPLRRPDYKFPMCSSLLDILRLRMSTTHSPTVESARASAAGLTKGSTGPARAGCCWARAALENILPVQAEFRLWASALSPACEGRHRSGNPNQMLAYATVGRATSSVGGWAPAQAALGSTFWAQTVKTFGSVGVENCRIFQPKRLESIYSQMVFLYFCGGF